MYRLPHNGIATALVLLLLSSTLSARQTSGLRTVGAASNGDAPPNVVFILADDLGWKDLSYAGSTFYESPNIDRIANEGMQFRFGYANCQVCSPSRAAIMTGKYPARLQITDWIGAAAGSDWKRNTRLLPAQYRRQLDSAETTLAEAFRNAGYRTFFAGKWHLGGEGSFPEDHGFDVNIGGHHRGSPPGGFFAPFKNPKMDDPAPGTSLPLHLGAKTAEFIEQNRNRPFFAFLSFYSVHGPIQTTPKLWKKYRDKAEKEGLADRRFIVDRTLPVRQVQDNPIYGGMIESMDQAVGIVLNKLESLDLLDRTVVVFTSDNGGVSAGDAKSTSNLPFRGGKGRQWEGGLREPYLIRFPPQVRPGSSSETPVMGTDFYPTLLELCGLESLPGQHVDGVSLVPLMQGKSIRQRTLFWHYPHYGNQGGEPSSIALENGWKLIHYYEDGHDELYNIHQDIGEQQDQAEQNPERVNRLKQQLNRHLRQVKAVLPESNPDFDPAASAKQQQRIREQMLPALEKSHAGYLKTDFRPNPTWWGSRPAKK